MPKSTKLIAINPISHGYLDGSGKSVEVAYAPGDTIDEELFEPEALERLHKKGTVGTRAEVTAAEAAAPPPEAPTEEPPAAGKSSAKLKKFEK